MPTVSIRDLSRNASGVVSKVASSGRPAIVTKHGAPVAAVIAIAPGDLEDFVLSHAASFLDDMDAADADLAAGRTRPAAEVFAELEG
jgi:prevent-host-death family protein